MKIEFHKLLNRHAVLLYAQQPGLIVGVDQVPGIVTHMNFGAEREDIKDWVQRIANWHFHATSTKDEKLAFNEAQQRDLQAGGNPVWNVGNKSSLSRLQSLLDAPESNGCQYWEWAGRVLHHIQDMSSPAHAIPVYHTSDDQYEACMKDYVPLLSPPVLDADILNLPLSTFDDPACNKIICLYHAAAERTMNEVETGALHAFCGGASTPIPLNEIWCKPAAGCFFGEYGPFAQHFGAMTFRTNKDGQEYTVNFSEYERIYRYFYCKAVRESVEALKLLLAQP